MRDELDGLERGHQARKALYGAGMHEKQESATCDEVYTLATHRIQELTDETERQTGSEGARQSRHS
jgi:hypothetical protein